MNRGAYVSLEAHGVVLAPNPSIPCNVFTGKST